MAKFSAQRRARWMGLIVFLVGLLNVVSALTPVIRGRVLTLEELFTPEATYLAAGVTALAGIALIMLGRGIAQRKRLAHDLTVALLLLATATHLLKGLDYEEAMITALVAVVLIGHRHLFVAKPQLSRVRRLARVLPALIGLDLLYGVASLGVRRRLLVPDFSFGRALRFTSARLVGLNGPLQVHGRFGHWFPTSLTALGAVTMAVTIGLLLAPAGAADRDAEQALIRSLIARPGADSLDPFAARGDKQCLTSSDRRSALAYRYLSGVALSTGQPLGIAGAELVSSYLKLCLEQGWRPAILGVREDNLKFYADLGLRSLYLGDEAVIDVSQFELTGRGKRRLRQAINHATSAGLRVEHFREGELPEALRRRLIGVAADWRRRATEKGFSMSLDHLLDRTYPQSLVAIGFDAAGQPLAFQRYAPYGPGFGLSLDAMRRRPNAPRGVNELMIARTVEWAKDRGCQEISLNFAFIRRLLEAEGQAGLRRRTVKQLTGLFSPYLQIESLAKFNAKFEPRWVQRYLVYQSRGDLAAISYAALRAERIIPY